MLIAFSSKTQSSVRALIPHTGTPHCVLVTPGPMSHLTCTKARNRGSLRCLALSCSRAKDWRLQKREEIFWNHEPSAPSNCRKMQEGEASGEVVKTFRHGSLR